MHDPSNDQAVWIPEQIRRRAWAAFIPSQATDGSILGYISQPAHAALAGRLAIALNGQLFDEIPDEIVETIGRHDTGWSEVDLAALEDAEHTQPMSFVSTPSAIAVRAWRRSIAEAERKSPQSAYVVRSHFCLLAPRDEDIEHELFRKEEETRLYMAVADLNYHVRELERFIAFLGFCGSSLPAPMLRLACRLCVAASRTLLTPPQKDAQSIPVSVKEDVVHVNE